MGKFSVDGDDYGEGPSNATRAKKRKITPGGEEEDDDVEIEPEATEDQRFTAEEDDVEQGSDEEEGNDAVADEADQINEDSDDDDGPVLFRNNRSCIGGRAVEIFPVTDERDKSISVIFTDPEVLDCYICYETLSSPVYQCENGHIACSSCCIKLGNKCPMCSMPIGYNRCRALEKVLEAVKVSCSNAEYGCKEKLSYSMRNEHEKECIYVPCLCPQSGCNTVASSKELALHFRQMHVGSAISFRYDCFFSFDLRSESKVTILQEKNDGNLFIFNNNIERLGNIVNVSCIGPNSSNSEFHYDLSARSQQCCLKLQSLMAVNQGHIANTPTAGFLLIPTDFFAPNGQITLEILIRREKLRIQHKRRGLRCTHYCISKER